jgi:hypothetical protein
MPQKANKNGAVGENRTHDLSLTKGERVNKTNAFRRIKLETDGEQTPFVPAKVFIRANALSLAKSVRSLLQMARRKAGIDPVCHLQIGVP